MTGLSSGEDIVRFLVATNQWSTIAHKMNIFIRESADRANAVLPLDVEFDVHFETVRNFDNHLLQFIIENPIDFTGVVRQHLCDAIEIACEKQRRQVHVQIEQIHVLIRFHGLPEISAYNFVLANRISGLRVLRCVVAGYSINQKYIKQSTWLCPLHCHEEFIIPEVQQTPRCVSCARELVERPSDRVYTDLCVARVFPATSLATPTTLGRINRSVFIRLTGNLCDEELHLGHSVIVTGVFDSTLHTFQVWNISEVSGINAASPSNYLANSQFSNEFEETVSDALFSDFSGVENPVTETTTPSTVMNIYTQIKSEYTDWSFVYAISAQLGQMFLPPANLVSLKMSLLLSIVATAGGTPLSIVAIGNDISAVGQLMNCVGNFAQRLMCLTDDFGGATLERGDFIEAGPIVLAGRGVCAVGDWARLKPMNSKRILKMLEATSVSIENSNMSIPLECSVWTYFSVAESCRPNEHNTVATFLNIFGVPIVIDDATDLDAALIEFALRDADTLDDRDASHDINIPYDELKCFLHQVSRRKVTMSPEATNLLREFFIATRLDRPESLSQRSFLSLQIMAESYAKISMRAVVLREDIVAVLYIAERFITRFHGAVLCEPYEARSISAIDDVDSVMNSFGQWIERYTGSVSRYN